MIDSQNPHALQEIETWFRRHRVCDRIVRIPGDASARSYYRVFSKKETFVVMSTDPFEEAGEKLPFLQVQRHFKNCGIDVPAVYESHPGLGLVLLEDLGDVTLLRKFQSVTSREVENECYQTVIDHLIQLQIQASKPDPKHPIDAFNLRFDFEKLYWEINHTVEHFYEKHLHRSIQEIDRATLKDGFSEICRILDQEPTVMTHRDFHSRNLMVLGNPERTVMIDFQDARMGPVQYDLASLLKDSYYQLDESQVRHQLDYYLARWKALTGNALDREHFLEVFDLMSIQRNFKAIGSFASFLNRRNDATYLKYIGNTFENIRRTLLKYPRYESLRQALFHYYYF